MDFRPSAISDHLYCITMTAVLTIPVRYRDNNDFRLLLKESFLISRDSEILLFLIRTLHRSWPENWLKAYNSIKIFLIFDNFHLFCILFVANFSYIIKINISSQLSDIFNIDLYSGVFPSVLKNWKGWLKKRFDGIHGFAKYLLKSYVSGTKPYVLVNVYDSSRAAVKFVISQGSVLAPPLFLIYIDDKLSDEAL